MTATQTNIAASRGVANLSEYEDWYLCPRCPRCLSIAGHWRGVRFRKRKGPVHRRCCTRCTQWFFAELESDRPLTASKGVDVSDDLALDLEESGGDMRVLEASNGGVGSR
ncbi:MAG: hypothetical protein AMXMBFR84_51350 [Candidatus Hydrogenedentota bacterium]